MHRTNKKYWGKSRSVRYNYIEFDKKQACIRLTGVFIYSTVKDPCFSYVIYSNQ